MRVLPSGPAAALIELDPPASPAAVAEALRSLLATSVTDRVTIVPAARTVLVEGLAARDIEAAVRGLAPTRSGRTATGGAEIMIEVDYDGDDLEWVASHCGLPVDAVIAIHTARAYTCAFCGFAPGFAYLMGLDPRLVVPRRDTPRVRVPAGAVAIAGEHTAVYPHATPGGWRLLGRSDTTVWDPARSDRPALITPGDRVRFVARR